MTQRPEPRHLEVGDLRLAYRDDGDPAAPPVVLLHGMASGGSSWHRVADALTAAGRRVVAPDLRGHGSSARAAGYPFDGFRDDVLGMLDRLGLDRVDLVGHSLGGHIATRVAEAAPDRIGRLVVEDAPPPPRGRPAADPAAAPRGARRRLIRMVTAIGSLSRLRTFDRSMARPVIDQFRAPDPAWWDGLAGITAPTLLIHGGPTSHVQLDALREMAAALPDARLVAIPVGHRIHSTRPDRFLRVVLPFLAGGEPGPDA